MPLPPTEPPGGRLRQIVFLIVLLAYFVLLYVSLGGLSPQAQFFPLITLSGVLFLWVLKLLATINPRLRSFVEPEAGLFQSSHQQAPDTSSSGRCGARRANAWVVWGWVVATLLGMYVFGFLAGMALAIVGYLRFIASETWKATLITAGVTVAFVYFVFVQAMHVDLTGGIWTQY